MFPLSVIYSVWVFVLSPVLVCFYTLFKKINIYGCDTFVFDLHRRTGLVLRDASVHTWDGLRTRVTAVVCLTL